VFVAEYAQTSSKQLGIHLALSALSSLQAKHAQAQATNQSQEGQKADFAPSLEELTAEAKAILPDSVDLPEKDFDNAIGEAYVFLSFRPSPSSFFPCCRSSFARLKSPFCLYLCTLVPRPSCLET
jgi:hypothetical protein